MKLTWLNDSSNLIIARKNDQHDCVIQSMTVMENRWLHWSVFKIAFWNCANGQARFTFQAFIRIYNFKYWLCIDYKKTKVLTKWKWFDSRWESLVVLMNVMTIISFALVAVSTEAWRLKNSNSSIGWNMHIVCGEGH